MLFLIKRFTILSIFFLTSFLSAEEKKPSLYYMKLGVICPPGDSDLLLPNLGLGARFKYNCYGIDLSANLGSMLFINYASLKGLILLYPHPEKKHPFYVGI